MDKRYEDLKFTDDFMFCKILYSNPDLCRQMLSLILGRPVRMVNFLAKQEEIKITYDGKGVRLDVYLEGDNKVYDFEMQSVSKANLPKRSRYYQGMIDLNLIEKGAAYEELRESYVIFICMEDPFGKNACVYTFENRCLEVADLNLKDATKKIFVNASGNADGQKQELVDFLKFLKDGNPRGKLDHQIADSVTKAVLHEEWRLEYMTLQQRDREKFDEGRAEGRTSLLAAMYANGKTPEEISDFCNLPLEEVERAVMEKTCS